MDVLDQQAKDLLWSYLTDRCKEVMRHAITNPDAVKGVTIDHIMIGIKYKDRDTKEYHL